MEMGGERVTLKIKGNSMSNDTFTLIELRKPKVRT